MNGTSGTSIDWSWKDSLTSIFSAYPRYAITTNPFPQSLPEKKEAPMKKEVEEKANALVKEEARAALLPYPWVIYKPSEDDEEEIFTYCPKCGFRVYVPDFRPESDAEPEHLIWACRCGYKMKTRAKDAPES